MGLLPSRASAAEVSDQLCGGEKQGEDAGGKATHGDHQAEPASVGVRSLLADAAKDAVHERSGDRSREEDDGACGEELARVGLHQR